MEPLKSLNLTIDYSNLIHKLEKINITTIHGIITCDVPTLCNKLGVEEEKVNSLIEDILNTLRCYDIRGVDLIDHSTGLEKREQPNLLSTKSSTILPLSKKSCATVFETGTPIDKLLSGGVRTGEHTEFSGSYGLGKTQTCFCLVESLLRNDPKASVIWIDTTNSFSASRLKEIHEPKCLKKSLKEKDLKCDLCDRIKVFKAFDVFEVYDILDRISDCLSSGLQKMNYQTSFENGFEELQQQDILNLILQEPVENLHLQQKEKGSKNILEEEIIKEKEDEKETKNGMEFEISTTEKGGITNENENENEKEKEFHNDFENLISTKLIIIDSVSVLLSPLWGRSERFHLIMDSFARSLKELAVKYKIAVLTTNSVVQEGNGTIDRKNQPNIQSTLKKSNIIHLKPALGEFWATQPSVRIMFTTKPSLTKKTRIPYACLIKSPRCGQIKPVFFSITDKGVEDREELYNL
ncbi:DNA repair protein rad51 [Anaeramoeba flamelloides]|uniref:DNA repair protein rad51 n=1 Tax=Anaeramoeba flamelloides TaxID=1746091 RepID=A0AAV8ADF6_9EUKA|nr:DNA repair protein rad51 [Anaeramoeba flamelloides]